MGSTWIWVLLVFIVISNIIKKAKKAREEAARRASESPDEPPATFPQGTNVDPFEELLREIQARKEAERARPPVASPQETTVSPFEDLLWETEEQKEPESAAPPVQNYDEETLSRAPREPLERLDVQLDRPQLSPESWKVYRNSGMKNPIADELKTREGLRRAFIASEILKRKY